VWGVPGVEDAHRLPAQRAGYPRKGLKAVLGVACLPGAEGLGRVGPSDTLWSPWPPLAVRLWSLAALETSSHAGRGNTHL
jgi:hypothetical protein